MSVTDKGQPVACTASKNATVDVRVFRNLLDPIFSNDGLYKQTINEDVDVASRVTSVQANDRDQKVRMSPPQVELRRYKAKIAIKR